MTEEEWLTGKDTRPMVDFLFGRGHPRKLRLFACACCRAVWDHIHEDHLREAVIGMERCADGILSPLEMRPLVTTVHRSRRKRHRLDWMVYHTIRDPHHQHYQYSGSAADEAARFIANCAAPSPSPTAQSYFDGEQFVTEEIPANADRLLWEARYAAQHRHFTDQLRCIIGNPFQPVSFDPLWQTETAVALAAGIYQDRAFDRLPILADALEEAGCDHADVLNHCRGPGPHARGCWVVDGVLDKR